MVSILGALIAVAASTVGEVAQAAIVIPVIVVGFAASWVQTGRVQRGADALDDPPTDRTAARTPTLSA